MYLVKAIIALVICLLQNILRSVSTVPVPSLERAVLSKLSSRFILLQAVVPACARPMRRKYHSDEFCSRYPQKDVARVLSEIWKQKIVLPDFFLKLNRSDLIFVEQ